MGTTVILNNSELHDKYRITRAKDKIESTQLSFGINSSITCTCCKQKYSFQYLIHCN